jgi:hydrophobe/amphiphile efflux-3 (HAE3) family protein
MSVRAGLERIARAAATRPLPVLLVVVLLALGGGVLALGLQPSTGADTLASRSSDAFRATDELHQRFGDDAVVVLIDERVTDLVLTADLGRTIRLEGCLGGNVPQGAKPYGGTDSPCGALARLKPVRVVYGPGTFLNESVRAVQTAVTAQLGALQQAVQQSVDAARRQAQEAGLSGVALQQAVDAARTAAQEQATDNLKRLVLSSGIQGIPQIDSKPFISQIVFDPARGADVPKARFASLFPSRNAALIQVRLRPDLSAAERAQAIRAIRAAVRMPMFASEHGGTYTVSGVPVVSDALADSVTSGIAVLLAVAVAAMALALLLLFRSRLRLLPLALALAAAGLTFGAMALAGAGLTMASIAVLPVLIGLAVDYAIQFQSRVEEQRVEGLDGVEAVARAARVGAPTIATAGLATATGFLVLLLSPVPMVRGFGLLLVVGIVLAFACALTAGSAALALSSRRAPRREARRMPAAVTGAGQLVGDGARVVLAASLRRPGRVVGVALALAVLGWGAETQTRVVSDVRELVPANLPALQDLGTLQDATASSGEIDVLVQGDDLARPEVVRWMAAYQQRVLRRFGFDADRGCRTATLCPAFSLPDLLQGSDAGSKRSIDALLSSVPPYFASAVLSPKRDAATLAFGIRLMDLEDQQHVIEAMRAELAPPPGVHARLAGLPVVAAQANADLASPWRRLGTLVAGLLAVTLVLLAVFRRVERALVPLVPIALATGWSALVLFATRVPLNPMSATLGALVIAISTEFAVLLSERFREERAAGHLLDVALARTYRSTGRAVLASGVTAIAGFGVLAVSDFRMLRDFGIVTVVDLTVSLLGVLVVLPSVLVLAERGAPQRFAARLRRARPTRGGKRAGSDSSAPVA